MPFPFQHKLTRFLAEKRGNAATIFALAALPLFFLTGAAIDYSRAAKIRGQLTSIADASAFAATTPAMMSQSSTTATTAVTSMFTAQASGINGLNYDPTKLNVNVTDTTTSNVVSRAVTLSYQAQVTNAFGALDQLSKTSFTVSSAVNTATAPNIDVYMLLDNSPSMELPATTSGITAMQNATGCALACHENNWTDNELTQYPGWGKMDSYQYAENNNITLRIDNVRAAAQNIAATAQSTMAQNGANYRMAVYAFNDGFSLIQSLVPTTSANVSSFKTAVGSLTPPTMDSNNNIAGNNAYTYPTSSTNYTTVNLTSALYDADASTNFDMAMTNINNIMPAPGNGTNQSGDSPQKVLFIVTDGVDDAGLYSSTSCNVSNSSSYTNTYGTFTRCIQPIDTSYCTKIKNRGIRIAVLYTTYYPMTSNSFYNSYVAPINSTTNSQIMTNLQNCASSPNMFFQVNTGGDINAAMTQLFGVVVATAPHLTQ